MMLINTRVNHQLWPVPLPRGVKLEDIRQELLTLHIQYTWLDVLCLRQNMRPGVHVCSTESCTIWTCPEKLCCDDIRASREEQRKQEWEVDVPLIGKVYQHANVIITYLSGLGRKFHPYGGDKERHWLKRAWTLQETCERRGMWIAGCQGLDVDPWMCKVCVIAL